MEFGGFQCFDQLVERIIRWSLSFFMLFLRSSNYEGSYKQLQENIRDTLKPSIAEA